MLAGKTVSEPKTSVAGCLIGRVAKSAADGAVTYAKQVSRILQKNCQECHRPGQIGPMSLLSYNDAVNWSGTIKEVVEDNRMPPWHADPRFGKWSNDRRLSPEDRDTLLAWLNGGLARGDDKDLPSPRAFPEGWHIGQPDVVVDMPRAVEVRATAPDGGVSYQYFVVPTGFTEDKWVTAAECKPGAPSVVHHILVYVVPRGQMLQLERP